MLPVGQAGEQGRDRQLHPEHVIEEEGHRMSTGRRYVLFAEFQTGRQEVPYAVHGKSQGCPSHGTIAVYIDHVERVGAHHIVSSA